jgi:hypothetical protein
MTDTRRSGNEFKGNWDIILLIAPGKSQTAEVRQQRRGWQNQRPADAHKTFDGMKSVNIDIPTRPELCSLVDDFFTSGKSAE